MYICPMRGIMKFNSFIKQYDIAGSVVLLEGKRNVPEDESPLLEALGRKLASETKLIKFRSGNASGADYLFSSGVASVDASRLEVVKPYSAHRQAAALTSLQYSLDDIDEKGIERLINETRMNERQSGLMKYFSNNRGGTLAAKARYILRGTLKVTGADDVIAKASFAVFYDDLEKPESGGTGHTMIVCRKCDVPFIDQKIWMKWLKE